MDKKQSPERADEWLKDIPIQAEPVGFGREEMIPCPKCGRLSPPTRAKCFYCAADLPLNETPAQHLKMNSRALEEWEKGFNVIYLPNPANENETSENRAAAAAVAKRLGAETEDLDLVFKTGKVLPLARLESEREAEILRGKLAENGIQSSIVADENLHLDVYNRRLRAIEFGENKIFFRLFNTGESLEFKAEDLHLIVVGAVFERKIESTESIKRKKENKENKVKDSAETSFDVPLIDLYLKDETNGYRIEANGFDFSGLGADKGLLATENMRNLAEKLRRVAPQAQFDEDYRIIRAALSRVWSVEERKGSGGVERASLGSFSRKNVTLINNSRQFNRYSRLRRNLL